MPKHGPWIDGITNRSIPQRSSAGSLKDAVNVVPTEEGGLRNTRLPELLQAGSFRSVVVYGHDVVLHGADSVTILNRGVVTTVPRAANCTIETPAGLLFVDDTGVFDATGADLNVGSSLPQLTIVAGSLEAGIYRVAFAELVAGREQPCFDVALPLVDGEGLRVTAPADGFVFASAANGTELYLVAQVTAGQVVDVPQQVDGRPPLHLNAQPMVGGKHAVLHNGTLVVAYGRFTHASKSYEYGVTDVGVMYAAWPARVTGLASANKWLYVGADRLYRVTSDGVDVMINEPVVAVSRTNKDEAFVVATSGGIYLVEGGKVSNALSDGFEGPTAAFASMAFADRYPFNGILAAVDHSGWPQGVPPLTL